MLLRAGQRLGPYEIVGPLGAGGMGEVYKARDPRLGRSVALKILPDAVASDDERLHRFEREARAVAQLNHPNVVTVHDTGTADGRAFIVSELLEGETLRSRMSRGKLPIGPALEIAKQIAKGLQAAHAKGIVHRDLKPENVMLTADGHVKLLDFGLAKVASIPHGPSDPTVGLTEPGIAMGTPSYMSPEQVRGESIDHRTDIFAFGAIVHEMLCGRRAFPGASTADITSAVLRADVPDISGDGTVPASLQRILQRCLEKDPAARFQTVADLAFALETFADSGTRLSALSSTTASTRSRTGLVAWIGGGLLAAAGVVSLLLAYANRPALDNGILAATILPPPSSLFGTLAVSPDGRWLAFTDESTSGKGQLWIRGLDAEGRTRSLPGTAGASNPFWSPDSRSIGFFADNQLKTIEIQGEVPKTIATVPSNRGGSWSRDGVILFGSIAGPLKRVSVTDRDNASPVSELGSSENTHRWPYFLPDGRHFLYFVRSTNPDLVGTYLASLDDPHGKRVVESTTNAIYAPPGFLLFVGRDGSLLAQPFDVKSLSTSGPPTTLVRNAGFTLPTNRGSFSASDTGLLVYGTSEDTLPIWFNRAGEPKATIGPPGSYSQVVLSSDDGYALVERPDPNTGANDVVLMDLSRGGLQTRLTTNPASDSRAIWMPKSDLVVYGSNRKGNLYDLYMKPANGAGDEALLFESSESKAPTGGTADGKTLLFQSESATSRKTSLWALTIADRHAFPLLETGFNEVQGRLSPDGKWMAYVTDKDGTFEIYVVDAAGVLSSDRDIRHRAAMAGIRVSTAGGTQPLWRRDSKATELFYVAPDRRLMAVSVGSGPPLSAQVPQELFVSEISSIGHEYQNFAVSSDGQRFLILVRPKQSAATVVMNWASILKGNEK